MPWGYREANHSPLLGTSNSCNTELHPSVQDGKARLGEGVLDKWALEV